METNEKNPTCCICGKECEDRYGHNPWPLKDHGVCCAECNATVVHARYNVITSTKFEVMRIWADRTALSGSELVLLCRAKTLDAAREAMEQDFEVNKDTPRYLGIQINDVKTGRRIMFMNTEEYYKSLEE